MFDNLSFRLPQGGIVGVNIGKNLTTKVEDAVNTLSGIDGLTSTSAAGASLVIIQFSLDKNGDVGAEEVRDNLYNSGRRGFV